MCGHSVGLVASPGVPLSRPAPLAVEQRGCWAKAGPRRAQCGGSAQARARKRRRKERRRAHVRRRRRRRRALDEFPRLDQMLPLLARAPRPPAHLHLLCVPLRAGQVERKTCHGVRSSACGPASAWGGGSGRARTQQATKKQRLTRRRLAGRWAHAPALERTRGAVADARCRKQRWSRHGEGGHARERGASSQAGSQHFGKSRKLLCLWGGKGVTEELLKKLVTCCGE